MGPGSQWQRDRLQQRERQPGQQFERRVSQRGSGVYGPGGYYDGNLANSTFSSEPYTSIGTLADVAMYYYKTDLRPAGARITTRASTSARQRADLPVRRSEPGSAHGDVPIGLGVDGYLTYDTSTSNPSYLSADY